MAEDAPTAPAGHASARRLDAKKLDPAWWRGRRFIVDMSHEGRRARVRECLGALGAELVPHLERGAVDVLVTDSARYGGTGAPLPPTKPARGAANPVALKRRTQQLMRGAPATPSRMVELADQAAALGVKVWHYQHLFEYFCAFREALHPDVSQRAAAPEHPHVIIEDLLGRYR
jgi:hypothetical protein